MSVSTLAVLCTKEHEDELDIYGDCIICVLDETIKDRDALRTEIKKLREIIQIAVDAKLQSLAQPKEKS